MLGRCCRERRSGGLLRENALRGSRHGGYDISSSVWYYLLVIGAGIFHSILDDLNEEMIATYFRRARRLVKSGESEGIMN